MKLFKTILLSAACVLTSLNSVPSHALIALGAVDTDYMRTQNAAQNASQTFLCLILLPFCILDAKAPQINGVTEQELAANGYSKEEIVQIQRDQQALSAILRQKKATLKIAPQDTRASVEQDLRSLHPNISDVYVEYFTEKSGL